jgi:perosamine synthetase
MRNQPQNRRLALSAPHLAGNEWNYVKDCLDSGWVSYAGAYVTKFEEELARQTGAGQAVAVVSGTAALHLAFRLVGVQADDEVVMPALSFVAPANAVRYCGAWPMFVDVREQFWQLDLDQLEEFLQKSPVRDGRIINPVTGRRVAAICVVHLLGSMADVDEAHRIAARFGLPLVEDAAECLGAEYRRRRIGERCVDFDDLCRIVVTSFNANKIVTSGGGGALLINDEKIADQARHLATTAKTDALEFFHDNVGFNYRMPNVLAALGLAQLEQLEGRVAARRMLADAYSERLDGVTGLTPMRIERGVSPNYWLYTVRLPAGIRRSLMAALLANDIDVRPPWTPLPKLPHLSGCLNLSTIHADDAHENGLSLPSGPDICASDIDRVASLVAGALESEN